jgi:hypothetical protein
MNSKANLRVRRRCSVGEVTPRCDFAWTVTARATRKKNKKMTATTSHWSGLTSAV